PILLCTHLTLLCDRNNNWSVESICTLYFHFDTSRSVHMQMLPSHARRDSNSTNHFDLSNHLPHASITYRNAPLMNLLAPFQCISTPPDRPLAKIDKSWLHTDSCLAFPSYLHH